MIVSRIDSTGDWTFGKGRANYARGSDAIAQGVLTRVRSFLNDWFADTTHGLPWLTLLGQRKNQAAILAHLEAYVSESYGVRSITKLRLVSITERTASIEIAYRDIFDTDFSQVVNVA